MAERQTRKAGLPKPRIEDPRVQKAFDAIIERIEVLDGLRGDSLDKAITFRDLKRSGFTVGFGGAGGTPQITNTPGGGTGSDGTPIPTPGPTTAPSNLAAVETFLAILLTWTNPPMNLQFIEIWRSATDNLSTATRIGTAITPLYVDYVGASASYYYWVRAVATDGSVSAFNDTAGTLGTTGVDPSDFEIELNISASNLDAALAARIDLIDNPTTGLIDRVTAAEGDIVSLDSRATSLEANVTGLTTTVDGNTTSITANASNISTNSASITSLLSDVGLLQNDVASNAASISANASSILNLEATIGSLDASGGETWEFSSTDDGFTAVNATIATSATAIIFTPSAANPQLISPTISLSGGVFTQIVVRLRQTIGGGTWEGNAYYETGSHGFTGSFVKNIPDPSLSLNQWTTLTWDMSNLTAGGTDWENSTITKIRLDLLSDGAGKFEIDFILIAKFSTTALTEAIDALDVRVTVNESGIFAQGTRITALESTVDNPTTGVVANATAITGLTTDVASNTGDISSNSSAIIALQSTVNNPTTGVSANASAIQVLESDVTSINGTLTSQASSITQLVASMNSALASIVNPLSEVGENYGTTFTTGELQNFNIGGRSGTGAVISTNVNIQEFIHRADNARINIAPRGVYEVKFSVYHSRPTTAGSLYVGMYAYSTLTGGNVQNVRIINNGVEGSTTANPYWFSARQAVGDNEWLDVSCYILGSEVSAANCPDIKVNGSSNNTPGYQIFIDGIKIIGSASYIKLRQLNFNASPTYGDGTTTTTYLTDLSVRRIDTQSSELYAALQTESSVRASDIGDLNAVYAVKVELNANNVPYVTGFGLTSDVINGTASSAFGIRADQFFITSPTQPTDTKIPFVVDLVDGVSTVGIAGQLIVDGSIRASSIQANSIGAAQIAAIQLSAINADMGTITAGLLRTAADPAFRVEIQDQASTTYPLWYGSGSKSAGTGLFYVDQNGDVVIKGKLDSGLIRSSYFAPSDSNYTFRIATQPNLFVAGSYTGKKAHFFPIKHVNFLSTANEQGTSLNATGTSTNFVTFYSPIYSGNEEYGRLGTTSETLLCFMAGTLIGNSFNAGVLVLEYRYDSEAWKSALTTWTRTYDSASPSHMHLFVTRETPSWSTVSFRLRAYRPSGNFVVNGVTHTQGGGPVWIRSMSLAVMTPNFGYADLSLAASQSGGGSYMGGTTIPGSGDPVRRWL